VSSPEFMLRAPCVECRDALVVPLPVDKVALSELADEHAWHLSVLTPPGRGPDVPVVVGLLCPRCAERTYSPELLAVAEERRRKRLAS
jgi:hypothetical protein